MGHPASYVLKCAAFTVIICAPRDVLELLHHVFRIYEHIATGRRPKVAAAPHVKWVNGVDVPGLKRLLGECRRIELGHVRGNSGAAPISLPVVRSVT